MTVPLLTRADSVASIPATTSQQQQQSHQQQQRSLQGSSVAVAAALDNDSIRVAVHEWVTNTDKDNVTATYGHISDWDTSKVTDFSYLWTHARFLDEDLSRWNTSRVTDMSYLFAFCSSFRGASAANYVNQDDDEIAKSNPNAYNLGGWDTSRVTSMKFAFHQASAFDGAGLEDWDVSRVHDLTYFAQDATLFNPNIWRWDTRKVRSFNRAFHNATRFSQTLCWELHPHAVAVQTFCGTNAGFDASCGQTAQVLNSKVNADFYDCCDCDYSEDVHYYGYHLDDDTFWQDGTSDEKDETVGIVLASCIWGLVLGMICLVVYVTLRRRDAVRDWLQSTLHSSKNRDDGDVTPDGAAIATFVGPAESVTTASGSTRDSNHSHPHNHNHNDNDDNGNNNDNDEIPMVIGADHIQYENATTSQLQIAESQLLATVLAPGSAQPWVQAPATVVDIPHAAVIQDTERPPQEEDILC